MLIKTPCQNCTHNLYEIVKRHQYFCFTKTTALKFFLMKQLFLGTCLLTLSVVAVGTVFRASLPPLPAVYQTYSIAALTGANPSYDIGLSVSQQATAKVVYVKYRQKANDGLSFESSLYPTRENLVLWRSILTACANDDTSREAAAVVAQQLALSLNRLNNPQQR